MDKWMSHPRVACRSYDASIRLWREDAASADGPNYTCSATLRGHTSVVSTVSPLPGGGLLSGSLDKHVIVWDIANSSPARILQGHSEHVLCVASAHGGSVLFSASIDKTARMWVDESCVHTLEGHEAAVWCVLPLDDGQNSSLTASADKTVKLWRGGECEHTYRGHEDAVRYLAMLPNVGFLSSSNDGTVRLWEFGGDSLRVLQASSSFVYQVAVLPSGEWLTCDEDRNLCVWNGSSSECEQSIAHPKELWACAALPNGDVMAGCGDGHGYVWTRTPSRVADSEMAATFKESVASVGLAAQQVEGMTGDFDASSLGGEEALAVPGTREGQKKMVKDANGTPVLYQWSSASSAWEKVGEIVGSSGGGDGASLGKKLYRGQEYDYVFDIQIDTGNVLKLPFNRGDDAWMAAQKFIWDNVENGVHQGMLDQVAHHIMANTPGNAPTAIGNADPFTSAGAYRPSSSAAGSNSANGNVDPFTATGAYRPAATSAPPQPALANGASTATQTVALHGSSLPFVAFDSCKHDAVLGKLLELNAQLAAAESSRALALSATDVEAVRSLVQGLKSARRATAAELSLFFGSAEGSALLSWPSHALFPCLDLLRLVLLRPAAILAELQALSPPLIARLLALVAPEAPTASDKAAPLMVYRCLANLLASASYDAPSSDAASSSRYCQLIATHASSIIDALAAPMATGSTPVRLAVSTVLLNMAALLRSGALATDADALQMQSLSLCAHALSVTAFTLSSEGEALYRVLTALATLLELGAGAVELARDLDLEAALRGLSFGSEASPKVKERVGALSATFSAKRSKQ